jgi:hypothetical protein
MAAVGGSKRLAAQLDARIALTRYKEAGVHPAAQIWVAEWPERGSLGASRQ